MAPIKKDLKLTETIVKVRWAEPLYKYFNVYLGREFAIGSKIRKRFCQGETRLVRSLEEKTIIIKKEGRGSEEIVRIKKEKIESKSMIAFIQMVMFYYP
jgi:hypothetical protein